MDENKKIRVPVQLDQEQHATLKAAAKSAGMAISTYLRSVALREARGE